MKKIGCIILTGFVMLFCAGCKSDEGNSGSQVSKADIDSVNSTLSALEEKIDGIEISLNDFIDEYDYNLTAEANQVVPGEDLTASPTTTPSQETIQNDTESSSQSLPENYDDYKTSAEQLLYTIKNNTGKELSKYSEYAKQIYAIDDKLDEYDSILEKSYSNGTITLEEYKKHDKALDEIEDILDEAQDLLEKQYGIDD